jgi:hypothetical protein
MIESREVLQRFCPTAISLIEVKTDLFQYIPITKARQPLGTFSFRLAAADSQLTLTISNHPAPPIVSFPISKKINMTFESHECWKVVDPRNKTWILQFRDPKEGLRALAVLGICWAVTDTGQPATWDLPNQESKGKAVSGDDTVKLSYHGFQVESFPIVDRYVLNQASFNTRIDTKRSPPRFSDLVAGMNCSGRRVIYLPNYPDLGSPVVFIVDLLRAKYASDPSAGPPEPEDEPPAPILTPEPAPSAPPAAAPSQPPPAEAVDEAPLDADAQRRSDVVSRMVKIGARPTASGLSPVLPEARAAEPEPAPAPSGAPARSPADFDRRVDERLELFEREFDSRLERLTEPLPVDQDAVITGIAGLAAQLRTRQSQIEQLQRQLADAKAAAANSPAAREYETIKREIDEGKKRGVQLDKRVKDNAKKLEELDGRLDGLAEKAKANGTGLIKRLMGSVFEEMVGTFEQDGRYTGQEIFGQLKTSLKRISLEILGEIERNGVL